MGRLPTEHELNLERGVRLSQLVGRGFGIAIGIAWLITVPFVSFPRLPFLLLTLGMLVSEILLWEGVWLAQQHHGERAARFIVTGIQLGVTTDQFVWASGHGIDAIVLVLLLAQTIPVGLSSVLYGVLLLRRTALITIGITAVLFLSGALWFAPHLTIPSALVLWLLASILDGTIAILLFGASVLYDQVLVNLGTLRAAYERAQQLDELKDQFITHVNHELRTPIMAMQVFIEYLQAARHEMPPEQEAQLFSQASRNADRLVNLLTNILDVRKIERDGSAMETGPVMVEEVVSAARQIVDPLEQRQIAIQLDPRTMVWADAQSLQQIVVNLFANAIKYSSPETPIEVSTAMVVEKGVPRAMQLRVRDYGLGIPQKDIPFLFHRFVRLPRDLASHVVGSGVGLYLCKVLTEAMNGRIWAESAGVEGEGSTFVVELPAVEAKLTVTRPRSKMRQRKLPWEVFQFR
jgi:signal transduction histidine kinase